MKTHKHSKRERIPGGKGAIWMLMTMGSESSHCPRTVAALDTCSYVPFHCRTLIKKWSKKLKMDP